MITAVTMMCVSVCSHDVVCCDGRRIPRNTRDNALCAWDGFQTRTSSKPCLNPSPVGLQSRFGGTDHSNSGQVCPSKWGCSPKSALNEMAALGRHPLDLSIDVLLGVCPLLVIENSCFENRPRGCANLSPECDNILRH